MLLAALTTITPHPPRPGTMHLALEDWPRHSLAPQGISHQVHTDVGRVFWSNVHIHSRMDTGPRVSIAQVTSVDAFRLFYIAGCSRKLKIHVKTCESIPI